MGLFSLPAALAIGTAATSAAGASQQNRAIERSMVSQRQAAATQQQQLVSRGAVESLKQRHLAGQIEGRARVAAAESGVGFGGSYEALARQADFDAEMNQAIIDRNVANELALTRSGYQANVAQLGASYQSPILQAFMGGIGGLGTGLQIGGGLDQLLQLGKTPRPDPFAPITKLPFGDIT